MARGDVDEMALGDQFLDNMHRAKTVRVWQLLTVIFLLATIGLSIALGIVASQDDDDDSGDNPAPQPSPDPTPEPPAGDFFPLNKIENWNVGDNFLQKVRVDGLDEGTWMTVDVSPNGEQIIFDLLGDIYTMPITGGVPTMLRSGASFDIQPRFSPVLGDDRFLYISDRGGCDNVWVGSLSKPATEDFQVSDSTYRWVSSAVWHPDGKSVATVKWYYSSRSLGAGEIWMYNVTENVKSDGMKLLGRNSPQLGPEEPFFSPDGKYLYFSRNTMDSYEFNYSKDVHKGIYTIFRYSFATGAIEAVAGGTGGASRPVVSHDSKTLAFVRRVMFSTTLVLQDLATGNEIILFDGLDHDLQACYAMAGTYPRFAFTPDNSAVVIWAQGKIYKIDVTTGTSSVVPFALNLDLDIRETARTQFDPSSGTEFDVKVVHSYSVSRDGKSVAYSAVGHTYIKSVDDENAPVRLAKNDQTDFEFCPTFSADGTKVVQTTWNDQALSTVQIVTVETGAVQQLTLETGRYTDPVLSPDGNHVAVTRVSSDELSGITHGRNPGVYLVDTKSSAMTKLGSSNGQTLGFSKDGSSVFVFRGSDVVAIKVADGSETVLASGSYITEIVPSPDMKYVAFVEFYHVYIVPLTVGMSLTSHPERAPEGVVRVSAIGGRSPRWADDSTLMFTLGADLYTVPAATILNKCGATSSGPSFNIDCAVESGIALSLLSFKAPSGVVAGAKYAFFNARVVTLDDDNTIYENGTILVDADKITAVGDSLEIPEEYTLIDVEGGVIVPGFIDTHAHWAGANYPDRFLVQDSWEFDINLAFGVTTLHNPSADSLVVFADAELVKAGLKAGPRLFSTGTIIYGAEAVYRCEINSLEDARNALLRLKAYGSFSAKSYNQPCRASRQMVLQAAKQADIQFDIVPEAGMAYYWNVNQIIDGHTTIEHSLPVAPLYKDVLELFAQSGTTYSPTFIVAYGDIWGERYWYNTRNLWEDDRVMTFHPHAPVEASSVRREKAPEGDYHHIDVAKSAYNVVYRNGERVGRVVPGAHGQRQGIGYHWELWALSQGGFNATDIFRAASRDPADGLGLTNLGRVAQGYLADLVVYPADKSPFTDIYNTEHVWMVVKDGRVYDAASMDQLHPAQPKPQGPVLNTPVLSGKNLYVGN
eukprot:TRINITY_DN1321_c0_g1::TRINITY_DN1321_c0_g1_i1::g.20035::m.20035 TRINITY_DN1321_c0_g1::TRINITY_DN1321_c0_g1_i1::g.20035  ORF type:complete len:1153 (+),score=393.41,sp/Q3SGT4/TOLB_THIDA/27.36/5e-06,Amidohydro_5/PF13594.1/1e-11,Amidohydro_5/PF13594.1/5.1e+03,PD40/PF07676.7/1.3e+03,PD40/PF07676.7/1.7e+03,PD40/PF07676.7/2.8e+02,PD40/PF07676.7/0.00012,PD40/PF07676.7/24,PD40/PF07676.7/2.8e+03,PD40/PF07676.7/2.4,PD40/PF07676.7/2.4,PD40/PF07676.7/1.2e+04,PD40/PF07676.7/2.2e+03,PD40/PF07676.7/3.6e+03,Ami